ncbi:chemotaxis protein CheD [Halobaculum magnesiiphilum]|uniref:Probable chemoreceptor glutamine deamidase CheD n=1 Tax=Halobaculum magnesiiphilum TaxID=1017351 RepID=A0A8T8W9N7_9EURY|nr:chemotaxis protein CheD [Halobaculum magnesiiphilum]QZP36540.1 chemotaxis protein CheD [Halobaculum magnesiiphilum]
MSPTGSPNAGTPSAQPALDRSAPRRKVGLSDAAVATDGAVLVTSGLGSCLGVALHDPNVGVGGLLHAMLPASDGRPGAPEKFVVDGIDATVAAMVDAGADPDGLRAKTAGAAGMIEFETGGADGSVGDRNVAAAEAALRDRGIPVVGTDTGGARGRSLRFDTATGALHVSYAGGETVVL